MPVPFCPKIKFSLPYTMQLFLVSHHQHEGKFIIVKHFSVPAEAKRVKPSMIKQSCFGIAFYIDFGQNFRAGRKGMAMMFDNLGGFQI
eukprot:11959227-Karenia_brevis.AAC.1